MKDVTIQLEEKSFEILEARVKEKKDFKSVEEYIQDLVRQVVDKLKSESDDGYSKEDEEKVKQRLRDLGYLE